MAISVHRPNSKERLFFFMSGAVISVPFPLLVDSLLGRYLTLSLPPFYAILISAAFIAPFFEEFAKAYPLFYRHGETEKSIVTLGFLTGLGFGIVEFLFYVFLLGAPVLIRLPALLFHATNTSIVAHGIAKNQALKFYLIAVGLHFLNNFSAQFGNFYLVGGITAILISYGLAFYFNRTAIEKTIDHWVQI